MAATHTVQDSLDAVETALKAEKYEQIDAALDAYEAAFETRVPDERLTLRRSQFSRLHVETTAETESTLTNYVAQFGGTNASRAGLLSGGEFYLLDPQASDGSTLVNGVEALQKQEATLNENRAAAHDALSGLDLPAHVAVLSITPESRGAVLGATIPVEIVVADIGDAPAREVSLSVESDLPTSPTETTVGSIAPGETKTVTVDVTANEAGEREFSVTIESANAGSAADSVTFRVVSGDDLIPTASDYIAELIERFENTSGLPGHKEHSFVVKLQHAQQHIDRAQTAIEHGNEKQADNALKTAINQMGAFLNEVATLDNNHGHGKSSPSVAFVQSVRRTGQVIIDQLARARKASLTS